MFWSSELGLFLCKRAFLKFLSSSGYGLHVDRGKRFILDQHQQRLLEQFEHRMKVTTTPMRPSFTSNSDSKLRKCSALMRPESGSCARAPTAPPSARGVAVHLGALQHAAERIEHLEPA